MGYAKRARHDPAVDAQHPERDEHLDRARRPDADALTDDTLRAVRRATIEQRTPAHGSILLSQKAALGA